ncbi:FeoA family protein [Thermovibrio sp.]
MKLSELKVGQRAKVIRVKSNPELSRKLRAMGLIKGEVITVEKVAPLGDPIEIRVKGTKLSLRKKEAENVEVEVI